MDKNKRKMGSIGETPDRNQSDRKIKVEFIGKITLDQY